MIELTRSMRLALLVTLALASTLARAADYPAPVEGEWTVENFRFASGETLPELRLHYRTIGDPAGQPVLILHGSSRAGTSFLTDRFAGELFGPGQPLDAARYYLILPDNIGAGDSSKPSDGLRARFPRYAYEDLVRAQYRLVTEHLGIDHLRLVIGSSAGGMQTWMWGVTYPDFMDALMPLAALPLPMSGRNWMMRRMLIDGIRNDPEWNGGDYETPPQAWQRTHAYFRMATTGGTLAIYDEASTREATDRIVDERLAADNPNDANNILYAYDASRDYNPTPHLERIEATIVSINAADDERNPLELGALERAFKRIENGRYVVIPASIHTSGHGTTGYAALWKDDLAALLREAPERR